MLAGNRLFHVVLFRLNVDGLEQSATSIGLQIMRGHTEYRNSDWAIANLGEVNTQIGSVTFGWLARSRAAEQVLIQENESGPTIDIRGINTNDITPIVFMREQHCFAFAESNRFPQLTVVRVLRQIARGQTLGGDIKLSPLLRIDDVLASLDWYREIIEVKFEFAEINPDDPEDAKLAEKIKESNLSRLLLSGKPKPGQGINYKSGIVSDGIAVMKSGYGDVRGKGVRQDGRVEDFDSRRDVNPARLIVEAPLSDPKQFAEKVAEANPTQNVEASTTSAERVVRNSDSPLRGRSTRS